MNSEEGAMFGEDHRRYGEKEGCEEEECIDSRGYTTGKSWQLDITLSKELVHQWSVV
jgi:hypothetical protein